MKKSKPRKTSSDKRVSNSRKTNEKTKHGRVKFDRRVRIEAKGAQITTDAGLLIMRDLADAIGLSDMAQAMLRDTRRGKNKVHSLDAMLLQSVFSRVAGYEDVNDADTLAHDPAMRLAVGGRAVDAQAASSSQMSRFERETLATPENLKALFVKCRECPCAIYEIVIESTTNGRIREISQWITRNIRTGYQE